MYFNGWIYRLELGVKPAAVDECRPIPFHLTRTLTIVAKNVIFWFQFLNLFQDMFTACVRCFILIHNAIRWTMRHQNIDWFLDWLPYFLQFRRFPPEGTVEHDWLIRRSKYPNTLNFNRLVFQIMHTFDCLKLVFVNLAIILRKTVVKYLPQMAIVFFQIERHFFVASDDDFPREI